ncbi:MAG: phosphate ABC transporter permease PstA [Bacillota bacterium]|jgi:phosphate transport system permease protein
MRGGLRVGLRIEEILVSGFLYLSVLVIFGGLGAIFGYILYHGLGHVNLEFLLSNPKDMGREGGILPAIVGTGALVGVALAAAAPTGILAAVFLTEYARPGRFVRLIHYGVNTLAGVPSIVFGLFGFIFFVIFLGFGWSILSGGLTLACMILPYTIKATEEAIKAVPRDYREASLSLGATRWQTVARVVLPVAAPGILTGVLLALGKAAGETAAILYTAGSSLHAPTSIMDPTRSLPIHLFILVSEGISFEKAYATASVLIILVLMVNLLAIYLMRTMVAKQRGK